MGGGGQKNREKCGRRLWTAPKSQSKVLGKVTSAKKRVVGPFSADSANSHQGFFSRVQKANGISAVKAKMTVGSDKLVS